MTHSLFWLQPLVPYFTICVVYYVSVVACSRNQPSTLVRASDRKSMFRLRVPCFWLFSNQPLSGNAIMPFIDSSTDSLQPTHIQFSNNAQVNIIFCDYRYSCAVMWGTAEYRPLLWRMHNHSKQCPKGNYGFYTTFSTLFFYIILKVFFGASWELLLVTCTAVIWYSGWFNVGSDPKLIKHSLLLNILSPLSISLARRVKTLQKGNYQFRLSLS